MNDDKRRPSVLLLRNVPERGSRSMERFADGVARGFRGHPRFDMSEMALHESSLARRGGLASVESYVTRFVRYPLHASIRRADIYHIADHAYGHVSALLPKARVVVSCHDLMLLLGEEGIAGFRGRRVSVARFRWSVSFLRSVARVVTPTESTKRDVVRLLGVRPERIIVAPYGVEPAFRELPGADRERLRRELSPRGGRLMLQVSTGNPYKNTDGVLRVLAVLRRAGTDVTLVRAGTLLSGEHRALARQLGVLNAIAEQGPVSEARLVELYNACDVLLFPSTYEGYGWPPLEAMACGLPVVISDTPALREVCGEAALAAPPRDIERLASHVGRILADAALADELRRRGHERAGEYTWQRTVDGITRAYEAIVPAAPL